MFMRRCSFHIHRNIMYLNMEYFWKNIRNLEWSRFLMKFSNCHTFHIYISITVPTESYPELEFFMKHEEHFIFCFIYNDKTCCKMSFEICFYECKFSVFLNPRNRSKRRISFVWIFLCMSMEVVDELIESHKLSKMRDDILENRFHITIGIYHDKSVF